MKIYFLALALWKKERGKSKLSVEHGFYSESKLDIESRIRQDLQCIEIICEKF